MDGPSHYRTAERLLSEAGGAYADAASDDPAPRAAPYAAHCLAAAQVHATLALAAATALNDFDGGMSRADYDAWTAAAGTTTETTDA